MVGPLNTFHLLMLGLFIYGLVGGDVMMLYEPRLSERKAAPYVFYGQTTSLCETCLEPAPAKIIIQDDCVWY
jgi:hypothetical protein